MIISLVPRNNSKGGNIISIFTDEGAQSMLSKLKVPTICSSPGAETQSESKAGALITST